MVKGKAPMPKETWIPSLPNPFCEQDKEITELTHTLFISTCMLVSYPGFPLTFDCKMWKAWVRGYMDAVCSRHWYSLRSAAAPLPVAPEGVEGPSPCMRKERRVQYST